MNGTTTHPKHAQAYDLVYALLFLTAATAYWINEAMQPPLPVEVGSTITAPVADLAPWLAGVAALLGLVLLYRSRHLALWLLGSTVCRIRGHYYFYPLGEANNWTAYTCVRCHALSQALEDLPYAPGPDDEPSYHDHDRDDDIERDYDYQRRWIARLPWPRWPRRW